MVFHQKEGAAGKVVDVRTELMGGNTLTKAMGPVVLAVNMRLIGMRKCG